jgi:cysteinyl-tRNA synthetase
VLSVYNTLSGKKEDFQPLEKGRVKMYVCGLTVQNYSHIGHIRSAINYDIIRRYLEYKGFVVIYIMNFTDINEKIVARAKEEGLSPQLLAEKYASAYQEDVKRLNVKEPTAYVRATENIDEIIRIVNILIDKGYAYEVNGNIYFSVSSFKGYGKLSGRSLEEMEAGARIDINEEKKNPMDFALWKKAPEGEISWDSPWGKGWPGWHIECSAMSMKYLGESFDIHGGGSDLIFPHHENEIAQSEACTGKLFAKYWLHNGTVNLKGEKMSKSVGNFYTARELLEGFNPEEIRYYLISKHYRSPIDFSLEELDKAKVSLHRLVNTGKQLIEIIEKGEVTESNFTDENFTDFLKESRQSFEIAMDDDFNSARAIGVLHELSRGINSFINDPGFRLNHESRLLVYDAYLLLHKLAGIMGLNLKPVSKQEGDVERLNRLIDLILEIREIVRKDRNWELADRIRDNLQEIGLIIKDTPHGVVWERDS